jgi:selenide,water dikinase
VTKPSSPATTKHLILVGGGHAHALFLKKLSEKPISNLNITLISPNIQTPYSGMLPGLISGHYQYNDLHIDLELLARKSHVKFQIGKAKGLNPNNATLLLEDGKQLSYDFLSFDTGATPSYVFEGINKNSLFVKPIHDFYNQWRAIEQQLFKNEKQHAKTLSVIGSGAAGIEILLAIQFRMTQQGIPLNYQLVSRSSEILRGYPKKLVSHIKHIFHQANITHIPNFNATHITNNELLDSKRQSIPSDINIICTEVKGASWLQNTGLKLSDDGFICVKETLQTLDFPNVYAVGDVCHFTMKPLPKAGVYAVRMSQILFENIYAEMKGKNKKTFVPQTDFLSLLALGSKTAIGCKRGLSFKGKWVWTLKNSIDLNFMSQFKH